MRIFESIRRAIEFLLNLVFQILVVLGIWISGLATFVGLRLFILIRRVLGLDKD